MKWNEVTWQSRLIVLALFLGIIPALAFYIGTVYQTTIDAKLETNSVQTEAASKEMSSNNYLPTPIVLAPAPAPYSSLKETPSPDANFVAHRYSDEQGQSAIYITDASGVRLTETYCGFFTEWSENSNRVLVYVPDECGAQHPNTYFYLYTGQEIGLIE